MLRSRSLIKNYPKNYLVPFENYFNNLKNGVDVERNEAVSEARVNKHRKHEVQDVTKESSKNIHEGHAFEKCPEQGFLVSHLSLGFHALE